MNLQVINEIITYAGSYVWLILSLAVIVYIAVKSDRPMRIRMAICVIGAAALILNEFSYRLIVHFVDPASYYRFMWAIPYVLIVTYGLVRIILDSIDRGRWYIGAIAMAVVMLALYISGGTLFSKYPNSAIENKEQVSDEVLTIRYLMDAERAAGNAGDELVIAYPRLVAIEYVTVDGEASSPTSRNVYYFGFDTNQKDLVDDTDYLIATICEEGARPDLMEARMAFMEKQLDYIVVQKAHDMEDYMADLGCSVIGETASYYIYRVDGNCYEAVTDEETAAAVMERTGLSLREIYISLNPSDGGVADDVQTTASDTTDETGAGDRYGSEIASYLVLNDAHTNFDAYSSDVTADCTETAEGRYTWAQTGTGVHAEDTWQNVAALIDYLGTDGVLMAGDMVDYASHENYELFSYGLEKFATPIMYVRADHDRGIWHNSDGSYNYEDAAQAQSALAEDEAIMTIEQDDYIILGWNDNTGNIGEDGLAKAKEVFEEAEAQDKPIILVCHVPLESLLDDGLVEASKEFDEQGRVRLWGDQGMYQANEYSAELLNMILADDSPVVAVLCGHLHFEYTTQLTDRITEYVLAPMFQGNITRVHICKNEEALSAG